eukprot:CAMPEP_0115840888 /NCGR_PEP_ID=MMETSP0287-20121206/7004_1 /TAXON_ID=412157 /ORGANISM="Chrysochromulina rotalis, Strain UIO044" /LENGTH=486 /DNA_ID=CAMNT_0003294515 /DNA_START=15 /DNA_END=1475 /DNA_ORIENTATION=-
MALFNAAKEDYAALGPAASEEERAAVHRKHAAEALTFAITNGGVYIKAAQFVASLQGGAGEAGVPREYVEALKPLTDRVPPRHFSAVAPVVEEQFGSPIGDLVESIDEWPVAAASLAQVHRAQLPADKKGAALRTVAIKLQYPTLEEQMASDFETLKMMASMIAPNGYDFNWIIEDIQKYVISELDFTREARNARAASDALSALSPAVLVPPIVDSLSSTKVMTTEFLDGLTRLDRPVELAALGLNAATLGDLVGHAFSELSLVNGLVHGDPHAGNVYARAMPGHGAGTAQLVVLDHGLYHRLTTQDRLAVCELILACATPFPNRRRVLQLAGGFAGALAPLFPTLLSPAFAFATGLNVRQLRAAAEGKLPEGTTLDDVWKTLVAMHDGESDVLGLLHSLGYVRGLQNSLNMPERRRVEIMVECAVRARHAARKSLLGRTRLAWAQRIATLRVSALFFILRVVTIVLRCLEGPLGRARQRVDIEPS